MWKKKKYKKIKEEIDENILIITQNNSSLIQESINDLVKSGGKRLRPLLVLLASKFGNIEKNKIYEIAAGIEIFHMSTLVHDDIIDKASIRRGAETAQKKFGNKMAVFIGDYLLSKTLEIFEKNLSSHSKKKLSKIVRLICEGEIAQHNNKFNYNLTVVDYFRRIRKKTALLFAYSMYLGAYESNVRGKKLHHLYNFGLEMGMAFQIEDDLLDFSGDKDLAGKKVNQDLKNGIYTLPVILLLEDEKERKKIISLLDEKKYSEIIITINKKNKVAESRKFVKKF
ncbi:MAG: polyprenyl synthetase family protein, partial [Bacillota bacterium]